jgi:hypothetical protein
LTSTDNRPVVAVVGNDEWLRPKLLEPLGQHGDRIRLAHRFGVADDRSPLATAAAQSGSRATDSDRDDVMVNLSTQTMRCVVVLATVDGRIGDGLIGVGGPQTHRLREFAKLAGSMLPLDGRRSRRPVLRRDRQPARMRDLLGEDSVAARTFAAPVATQLRSLDEVCGHSDGA